MQKHRTELNIKVNAYSGYKANERPVSFIVSDLKIGIIKVIDRWKEPDRDYFKVLGDDGNIYTMAWDREKDIWLLTNYPASRRLGSCRSL